MLFDPQKQAEFEKEYQYSIQNPEEFWAEQGKRIDWVKPYTKIKDVSFDEKDLHIRWYYDATLNACYNCLDRHLATKGDQVAFYWEGDDTQQRRQLTYKDLHGLTCRIANVLKAHGVRKGDRVTIYLPMIPEAVASMLACARIGAIHSVVFGGFSSESLASRITDCESKVVLTADGGYRGGKALAIKEKVLGPEHPPRKPRDIAEKVHEPPNGRALGSHAFRRDRRLPRQIDLPHRRSRLAAARRAERRDDEPEA